MLKKILTSIKSDQNKPKENAHQEIAPASKKAAKSTINLHIVDYIHYYIDLKHAPFYAIMVSGPWGTGKTHLVKKTLKDLLGNNQYIYVSVYGISHPEEIDLALLHAIYPLLSGKTGKIAGKTGKAILKYLRLDNIIKADDFLSNNEQRIYVFDDIERSTMAPESILGYINELVEHDGCKVIIIANEEKLLKKESYAETREKLIGRTLEVLPDTELITEHLIENIDSPKAKAALKTNSKLIELIFKEAGTNSFRVLQQTIWDFESLANCLSDEHLENKDGISSILKLFLAIALEFKAGELTKEDIATRPDNLVARLRLQNPKYKEQLCKIEKSNNRFSEVDIYDSTLNNEILSDILTKGKINKENLITHINTTTHFSKNQVEPAWRTLWHAHERDDEKVDRALTEVNRQLENGEIEDLGIILHITGIKLWLSDIGRVTESRAEIISSAKSYADNLYNRKLIQPLPESPYSTELFHGAYGLGIHEHDSQELKDFLDHYKNLSTQAKIDKYPEQAAKLLEEMEENVGLFYRRLNVTNSEDNIYATTPILAYIDPKIFCDKVINLPPDSRSSALAAINCRHNLNYKDSPIEIETSWISEVFKELSKAANGLSATQKWGLLNSVRHYLEPLVIKNQPEQ